jgi:intracellular sulfur oxidation DsrE/DsrF family protein
MKHKPILHGIAVFLAVLVLTLAAARADKAVAAEASAKPKDDVIRVVYHADFGDPRRFSAMLTNIGNMVNVYQSNLEDYDIRIVFVSYGIRFVTRDSLAGTAFAEDAALKERRENLIGRLESLRETYGVKLELCGITREQVGLDEKKLIPGVQMVPSGVARIVELERKGYAYLKVE